MLTSHCTSLKLSLALRESGYPQVNALFYWSIPKPENADNEEERLVLANNCEVELCHKWTDWGDKFDRVAAPLASEIFERLPDGLIKGGNEDEPFQLTLTKNETDYCANYESIRSGQIELMFEEVENEEAPTNALGRLFLHLRQEQLI